MTSKRIMANTFNALDDANIVRNSFSVIGCAAGRAEGPSGSVTAVSFHIDRLHLLRLMCVDSRRLGLSMAVCMSAFAITVVQKGSL
jgi:hypothetical protein